MNQYWENPGKEPTDNKKESRCDDSQALKQLIALFENPKKINNAEAWKKFFISEDFLREQNTKEFADGMFQYLSQMHTEDNYRMVSLPSRFLMELAIAYALVPERNNAYIVNASGDFYGRFTAANIWNMQKGEYPYPIRILFKPENIVRLRSFSDYFCLKDMNQKNAITRMDRSSWENILEGGQANHLYELLGKGYREIYESTRSTCLITLYTIWLQTEKVPDCVLEYMYKEYGLKNIEHTSTRRIYEQLKQEILKQYPQIEKELFDENGRIQMISNWHRCLMRIVSDNHSDYDKGLYEESHKIKERTEELFLRPEWEKIQYDTDLFEKMFHQLYKRKVMPKSLTKRLIEFYSKEGPWEDESKVQLMLEGLYCSLGFNRRIKEIDGIAPVVLEKTRVEDIGEDNREFWFYYLMHGFGIRRVDIGTAYAKGSTYYLPAYINELYYPSLEWQKLFTGFDKGVNQISHPVSVELVLPDKKKLRVEFHLHYVLYYLDDELVYEPKYTWEEFVELAQSIERTEHFFFFLAITRIMPQERSQAIEQIENRLRKLPLYPPTISVIAQLLAQDNDRNWEKERMQVLAVYYAEQERFCFRLMVTDIQMVVYRQTELGWSEFFVRNRKEWGQDTEEEEQDWKREAEEMLQGLRQPQPVSIGVLSLEGMDNLEKGEKIIEALKQHVIYNRENTELPSFVPGVQWEMEQNEKVRVFFEKDGIFLTESYCVLRYGPDKRNERVFYCSMNPYGFDVMDHNVDFETSYRYNLYTLDKKIKENYRIVGRFGWGKIYNPKSGFEPEPIAIGESGTFYGGGCIRLYKTESLAELLTQLFDFTNVTEVESYQGCLSISRLDYSLEYCYGKEDFYKSVYSTKMTWADLFTKFTKTEWIWEFARWMDKALAKENKVYVAFFELMQEGRHRYSLNVYNQTCFYSFEEDSGKYRRELLEENKKLVWKNEKKLNILEKVGELIQWYMENGTYGEKLKACLKIEIGFSYKKNHAYEGKLLYKNVEGIIDGFKKRTAMQACSLVVNKERIPGIFDSKFGGMPYWNKEKEYPTDAHGEKLELIAQINLEKNKIESLPDKGMLQLFGKLEDIFIDGFGTWENQDKYRVVYHENVDASVTMEELCDMELPDSTKIKYTKHIPISREMAVDVKQEIVYMGKEDYRFYQEFSEALREKFDIKLWGNPCKQYEQVLDEMEQNKLEEDIYNAGNWLLGYPEFASERKDPRGKEEKYRQYDRLLFQFDVHYLDEINNEYYFDHGGCGIANFFIRSEDLKNKDFSHVMYHWECCEQP